MKDIILEDCPIHRIQPFQLGPDLEMPWLPGSWKRRKDDLFWILDSIFPGACLFASEYTVFCPECAKKNPMPGKHNKFGSGFTSQYSIKAAMHNWNKACMRYAKRAIMDVLNGKEVVSMYDDKRKV